MKKLGWYVVSAAVAAFILGGTFLLAANLYVQSRAVQQRIRQALRASLRMPVSLRKTTFTPWDGLRIDGITAHLEPAQDSSGTTEPGTPNSLTAVSFRVYFALVPLLRRQFVVEDVLLDRPRLSWTQDEDDRWRLPEPDAGAADPLPDPPAAQAPPAAGKNAPPPPDRSKAGVTVTAPATPPVAGRSAPLPPVSSTGAHLPRFKLSVDKFRLRHGSMDFMNHSRGLLGRFEEVDVDGWLEGGEKVSGFATVAKASLPRAGIRLTRFQSNFDYDHQEGLALQGAQATLADGRISADCRLRTGTAGTPYTAQCRLENIGIGQLIKEAGGKHAFVDGRLQGTLNVSGASDDADHCRAAGNIQLDDTRIHDFPLFQAVGEALRIDDLRHLRFKTARLDYRLEGTVLEIQPLVLASDHVQIKAEGRYQFRADHLDLHARLTLDEMVTRQLPRFVGQQFTPCGSEAPGACFIDFKVNGPLNKLSSNLYERILPNSLDNLLDSFLRPRPKRAREKASPPDEERTPPVDTAPEADES